MRGSLALLRNTFIKDDGCDNSNMCVRRLKRKIDSTTSKVFVWMSHTLHLSPLSRAIGVWSNVDSTTALVSVSLARCRDCRRALDARAAESFFTSPVLIGTGSKSHPDPLMRRSDVDIDVDGGDDLVPVEGGLGDGAGCGAASLAIILSNREMHDSACHFTLRMSSNKS